MELEINTPQKTIYHDTVKMVRVPGTKGSFQILNNHSPIISTLEQGKITIKNIEDITFQFEISDGIIECLNNKIVILTTQITVIS